MNSKQIHVLDGKIRTSFKRLKQNESELIELLQEMDQLMGYKLLGYASLWEYAVKALEMTEGQASAYITVSRKALEVRALDAALKSGELSVSKAKRVTALIHPGNAKEWIEKAKNLTQNELDRERWRFTSNDHLNPEMRARMQASGGQLYRVTLAVSGEFLNMLDEAQELLEIGSREIALEKVLADYLDKHDPVRRAERAAKKRKAHNVGSELPTEEPAQVGGEQSSKNQNQRISKTSDSTFLRNEDDKSTNPGNSSESALGWRENKRFKKAKSNIPRRIINQVHLRDRGRCQYRLPSGQLCQSRRGIHVHHLVPRIAGGRNEPENLLTLCASHHRLHHFLDELRLEADVVSLEGDLPSSDTVV